MDWYLIDIFKGRIEYNRALRAANSDLSEYVDKSHLHSWCNEVWVPVYTLTVL